LEVFTVMSDSRPAGNWATEATLQKIAQNTGQTVTGLERLLQSRLRGTSALDQQLQDTAATARQTNKTWSNALNNLNTEMRGWSRSMGVRMGDPNTWSVLGRRLTGTSSVLDRLGGSSGGLLSRFGGLVKGLGPVGIALGLFTSALGFATGIVTGVVRQLVATNSTLINLVQSGIMFNGSVLDFNVAVGRAGLSAEEFAQIARESAGGIRAFGETAFLQTTNRLSQVFGQFALNIQQGNEYFADYLETSRLAGHVYVGGMQEQSAAFELNIRQQHELAALTGKTVAEQRRAARARAEGAQYRMMMAALPEEERKRMEQVMAAGAAANIPEEVMRAKIMQFRFNRTSQEAGRLSSLMPELDTFFQRMATGQVPAEQMGAELQSLGRSFQGVMQDQSRVNMMLHMFGGSLSSTVDVIGNLIPTMQGLVNPTREVQEALERLRQGLPPFASDTRALNDLQDAWKRITTALQAEIMNLVGENGLKQVLDAISQLGSASRAFVAANPDRKMQAFMESLSIPDTSPLMRAARQVDEATGFLDTFKAIMNLLWVGLQESFSKLGEMLDRWTRNFVEELKTLLPWWLGGGGLTERQRGELATGQQQRIGVEQRREVAPGLTAQGMPVQIPALPERPAPGANIEERRQAALEAAQRAAALNARIEDLEYRLRPGETNEELVRLRESFEEATRVLRDINRGVREQ